MVETGRLPAEGVQRMFDRIAPVYDAMNRVMTGGLDRRWRRITVEQAVRPGDRVLDACCGTGDLALAARSHDARGVDGAPDSQDRGHIVNRDDHAASSCNSSAGRLESGNSSAGRLGQPGVPQ